MNPTNRFASPRDAVIVDGASHPVAGNAEVAVPIAPGIWSVIVGTRSVEVVMDPRVHLDLTEGEVVDAHIDGVVRRVRFDDARRRDAFASTANVSDGHHAVNVVAPMPGRIIEIRVSVGDAVTRGDTVAMIEAMKMESAIIATHPGTIAAVLVERGTVVATRQPLLRIESA